MTERTAHVALVTGGGGGIGAAIARRLARAGAFVHVGGRDQERCRAVVDEIRAGGGEADALSLDVTQPESIACAVVEARARSGRVDWLVNNAGIAISAALLAGAARDLYERHMDVNFHGPRRVLEALLPDMLEAGYGRVVQVASSAALRGYAYVAAYAASKHALLGYTRSASIELEGRGVAIHALCPWYVDSPMTDEAVRNIAQKTSQAEAEARAFLATQNPGGVFVTPDEVAETAFELLASDTTGAVVELVGGGRRTVEEGRPLVGAAT